jgi:hypothetical protein
MRLSASRARSKRSLAWSIAVSFMKKSIPVDLELHPDAWRQFERAVDVVAKSPPQHRSTKEKRTKRAAKTKRPTKDQ